MQNYISLLENNNSSIEEDENDLSFKQFLLEHGFENNNINVEQQKELKNFSIKNKNLNTQKRNPSSNNIFTQKKGNDKFTIIKEKIFNIKKEKKLGRPKKENINQFKKRKHDKFQRDNIIRKFKAQFVQNLFNYINLSFNSNQDNIKNKQKPINIIQKINSSETKSISKDSNLKWLNSKIRDIFSQKISSKFVSYEPTHNYKIIQKLYEKKEEQTVLKVMDKTIRQMWIIYVNNDKNNEFPGFNTIENDINKFRNIGESEEYIELYISISQNFEMIFNKMKSKKKIYIK